MNVAAPGFLGSGREREAVEQRLFHQHLGWDASLLTATSPITWAFFLPAVFSDTGSAFPKSKSPLVFQQLLPSHCPPTHILTHIFCPGQGTGWGLWHQQRDTLTLLTSF